MRPDPDIKIYEDLLHENYSQLNYERGLAAWFMRKSHQWSEKKYVREDHFSTVLEVGAGTGIHIQQVRHAFDQYIISDIDDRYLKTADVDDVSNFKIVVATEDATNLSFPDNSIDRLIAAHVLEHLPNPHLVLKEWHRVLKPGAAMTILLPCDPGIAWRLGRCLGTRPKDLELAIEYDYWMAREHINSITNLVSLIRYYFDDLEENWLPSLIPNIDINLFYICHIRVSKTRIF